MLSLFAARRAVTWGLSHQCSHGMGLSVPWAEGWRNHSGCRWSEKEVRRFLLSKNGKKSYEIELKIQGEEETELKVSKECD